MQGPTDVMPFLRRHSLAALLASTAMIGALPALAEVGDAGAYLAARYATAHSDYSAAATYFAQALAGDEANPSLLEDMVVSDIAIGDIAGAVPAAQKLQAQGTKSQAATIVVLADLLHNGRYDEAIKSLAGGQGIGTLVDGLVTAWADVGAGRMSDGLADFDKLAKVPGLQAFGLYHKALAMASVGDFEGAEKIFSGKDGVALQLQRRGLIAYAEVLSQLDRDADALALLNDKFGTDTDPSIDPMKKRLAAGEVLPFDVVRNAQDGLSEVFFSVAAALKGQAADSFTLVYGRIAQYLSPDNSDAVMLVAGLLQSQKQYDLALVALNSIPRDAPAYYAAQQIRAQTLYAQGNVDAGVDALKQLAAAHPDLIDVQVAYADLLRQQERFPEATAAYDAAVALIKTPQPGDWAIYYMRGISEERQGLWDKAEPDLREALVLRPDEPEVLNYLGYALVERGEKMDEATDMIKRAVVARPDDGYIVDSLSWVYYRTGQYDKALPVAERASQLMPVDPVVTDHLGDVYWAVGRKLEAQFQWHRALSFSPDPKDAVRIRRKLDVGLDAVLKEEGGPPLKTTSAASGSASGG